MSLLVALATSALANGGTPRTTRARAGPYAVTVFTSPTPLGVGVADVSASVERADTGDLEPDARVIIAAEPVGHAGQAGVFEATHDQASDPNFYAANVRLDSTGTWRFAVQVIGLRGEGALTFDAPVEETGASTDRVIRGALVVAVIWAVVGVWFYRRRRGSSAAPAG